MGSALSDSRRVYLTPLVWVLVIAALFSIPLIGYVRASDTPWEVIHPAINGGLNALSAILLFVGWRAIKRGARVVHAQCMIAAFSTSALFLVSYLIRYYISGTHRYPGDSWDRTLYLVILSSHTILAITVLPLILRLLYLARKGRYKAHAKIARWAWPIWMYVSVTGVTVYIMLYHVADHGG